ncbi:MAG: L,D-transpeptidase family protein [Campylobacterota bacterium]
MKKIFLLLTLFLLSSAFAQDIVSLYEKKGLKEVEKYLDRQLFKKEFWKKKLEEQSLKFGYMQNKQSIIHVNKNKKILKLYKYEDNNYKVVLKKDVIVGEVDGDKLIEGDKKTPIGVYNLLYKKQNLDQFYGPMALTTSYPNSFDKSLNKTGHGIWIHGMPLKDEREKFTQGCIALDNEPLKQLDSKIDLKTSLLITSQSEIIKPTINEISSLLSLVYKWRYNWKYSKLDEYLNFYSNDFKWYNGMNKDEFSLYKKRVFSKNEEKLIKFSNIQATVYPNSLNKRLFRVFMDEYYKSDNVKFVGTKELIVEYNNGTFKILFED